MFRSSRVDDMLLLDDDRRRRTRTLILWGHGKMESKDTNGRGRQRGDQQWRLEEPLRNPISKLHITGSTSHAPTLKLWLSRKKRWILPGCVKRTLSHNRSVTTIQFELHTTHTLMMLGLTFQPHLETSKGELKENQHQFIIRAFDATLSTTPWTHMECTPRHSTHLDSAKYASICALLCTGALLCTLVGTQWKKL